MNSGTGKRSLQDLYSWYQGKKTQSSFSPLLSCDEDFLDPDTGKHARNPKRPCLGSEPSTPIEIPSSPLEILPVSCGDEDDVVVDDGEEVAIDDDEVDIGGLREFFRHDPSKSVESYQQALEYHQAQPAPRYAHAAERVVRNSFRNLPPSVRRDPEAMSLATLPSNVPRFTLECPPVVLRQTNIIQEQVFKLRDDITGELKPIKYRANLAWETMALDFRIICDKSQLIVTKRKGDMKDLVSYRILYMAFQSFETYYGFLDKVRFQLSEDEMIYYGFTVRDTTCARKDALYKLANEAFNTWKPSLIRYDATSDTFTCRFIRIFFDGKHYRTVDDIVFNPKPSGIYGSSLSNEINLFTGIYANKDRCQRYGELRDTYRESDESICPYMHRFLQEQRHLKDGDVCYLKFEMGMLFEYHIRNVIVGENQGVDRDEAADSIIRYIAHMIIMPWEITTKILSIHGCEGSGKTLFMNAIARMLGSQYYAEITHITDLFKFNDDMDNKIFISIEEANQSMEDKKVNSGYIKAVVTGKTRRRRAMYKSAQNVRNYWNLGCAGNHGDRMIMAGCRRIMMTQTSNRMQPEYYVALLSVVRNQYDMAGDALLAWAHHKIWNVYYDAESQTGTEILRNFPEEPLLQTNAFYTYIRSNLSCKDQFAFAALQRCRMFDMTLDLCEEALEIQRASRPTPPDQWLLELQLIMNSFLLSFEQIDLKSIIKKQRNPRSRPVNHSSNNNNNNSNNNDGALEEWEMMLIDDLLDEPNTPIVSVPTEVILRNKDYFFDTYKCTEAGGRTRKRELDLDNAQDGMITLTNAMLESMYRYREEYYEAGSTWEYIVPLDRLIREIRGGEHRRSWRDVVSTRDFMLEFEETFSHKLRRKRIGSRMHYIFEHPFEIRGAWAKQHYTNEKIFII